MKRGNRKPGAWMTDGAKADYHPIIDAPESRPVTLRGEPFKSSAGYWVAFTHEVRGFVCCEALSRPSSIESSPSGEQGWGA